MGLIMANKNGLQKERFDAGLNYDEYYGSKNGEESIYSKQYQGGVIPRDESLLLGVAEKCMNHNKGDVLKILDHGFGDGRYFGVIEKIADKAQKKNKKVELIAYEPSLVGLRNFANAQKERGYEGVDSLKFKDISKYSNLKIDGYCAGSISKGNLAVKFIHNDVEDSISHAKKLVGEVGMVMSMFGVLSHIPGRKNRQNILKMFNDITNDNGKVVVTLPTYSRFAREREAYKVMREHEANSKDSLANEEGDLYYCKFSESQHGDSTKKQIAVKNFYHVYKEEELKEDLTTAGLRIDDGIQANHILDIKQLIKNPLLGQIDAFVSMIAPVGMSSYMSAVSSPQKNKDKSVGENEVSRGEYPSHKRGNSLIKSASWSEGFRESGCNKR